MCGGARVSEKMHSVVAISGLATKRTNGVLMLALGEVAGVLVIEESKGRESV